MVYSIGFRVLEVRSLGLRVVGFRRGLEVVPPNLSLSCSVSPCWRASCLAGP